MRPDPKPDSPELAVAIVEATAALEMLAERADNEALRYIRIVLLSAANYGWARAGLELALMKQTGRWPEGTKYYKECREMQKVAKQKVCSMALNLNLSLGPKEFGQYSFWCSFKKMYFATRDGDICWLLILAAGRKEINPPLSYLAVADEFSGLKSVNALRWYVHNHKLMHVAHTAWKELIHCWTHIESREQRLKVA